MGVLDAFLAGRQARAAQDVADRENALQSFLQQNGQALFAGDQNALGQLAGLDPQMALGIQSTQMNMAATRSASGRAAAEWARQRSAEEVAAEAAKTEALLKGAAYFHANGDRPGYENYVRQQGGDPAEFPFEQFPAIAAAAGEVLGVWREFQPQPYAPQSPEGKLAADVNAGVVPPPVPQTGYIVTGDGAAKLGLDPTKSYNIEAGPNGMKATMIGSGADTNQTERDIALLGEIGIPRADAIKITQLYTVSRDPVTGETIVIDKATGQPVNQQPPQAPAPVASPTGPQPPAMGFGEQFPRAPEAFGLGGAARGLANTVTDVVGLPPPFPEAQRAQADFAVLQEKLINDIASAYDRQPPSWLLQNIRGLTPQAGSVFTGSDQAAAQLDAIGRDLSGELQSVEAQLEGRLSPDDREILRKRLVGLKSGIRRIETARGALRSPTIGGNTTSTGVQWSIE